MGLEPRQGDGDFDNMIAFPAPEAFAPAASCADGEPCDHAIVADGAGDRQTCGDHPSESDNQAQAAAPDATGGDDPMHIDRKAALDPRATNDHVRARANALDASIKRRMCAFERKGAVHLCETGKEVFELKIIQGYRYLDSGPLATWTAYTEAHPTYGATRVVQLCKIGEAAEILEPLVEGLGIGGSHLIEYANVCRKAFEIAPLIDATWRGDVPNMSARQLREFLRAYLAGEGGGEPPSGIENDAVRKYLDKKFGGLRRDEDRRAMSEQVVGWLQATLGVVNSDEPVEARTKVDVDPSGENTGAATASASQPLKGGEILLLSSATRVARDGQTS